MSTHRSPLVALGIRVSFALYGLALAVPEAGCGDECSAITGDIVSRPGTGDPANPTTYRALEPGASVQLTTGNQGGQHLWVQLRASNVCPTATSARVRAFRASDGERVGQAISTPQRWTAVPGEPGAYASETLAVQVDDRFFCSLLQGGRVRIEYSIDDGRGTPGTGSTEVVVQGWSADSLVEQRDGRDQCCRDFTNTTCWPDGPPADAGAGDASADATGASDASPSG